MKTKHKIVSTTMRVILITAAACGLAYSQSPADKKVKIDTAPIITIPNAISGVNSWGFDSALQEFLAPVGQFTGLNSSGTSINYEDLIPLKSSKIQIVSGVAGAVPTGVGTIIDANGIETNSLALLDAHTNLLSSITLFDGLLLLDGFPLGTEGPAGEDGAVGPIGPQGPVGTDGAVGPIGPQGPAGADGAVGPIGPQGPAGADGAVGPIGPQGPAGANGAAGPIGPQGTAGADGAIGPIGPQGPAGANGAVGPIGPQGPAGANGAIGPIGPIGPQGPQGEVGDIGPIGPQGPAGQNLQALGNLVLDTPQDNPGNVATTPGQIAINITTSAETTLAAGPVIWNGVAWVSPLATNSDGVALLKGKVVIEQAQGDISMGVYE